MKRHLRETGLIHQCYRLANGYWRIPYHVAAEIANPEALSLREKEAPRHPPKAKQTDTQLKALSEYTDDSRLTARSLPTTTMKDRAESPAFKRPKSRVEILTQPRDDGNLAQHYGDIGKVLRQAGVSLKDFLQVYQMR